MDQIWRNDQNDNDQDHHGTTSIHRFASANTSTASLQSMTSISSTTSTTGTGAYSLFHRLHFPIDLPHSFYQSWNGHGHGHAQGKGNNTKPSSNNNNNNNNTLTSITQIYSNNELQINLPPFTELLGQQLLAPFFLFQLFCVVLWSMDEYWYYSLFTLFTLVMFECTVSW